MTALCPFCGSTDLAEARDHVQDWTYGERVESWVECRTCGAHGPVGAHIGPGQVHSVATWESRAGAAT